MLNRSALATSIYVGGLDGGSGTEENPRPTALISGTTMTMVKERVIQVEVLRMQVDVEPWSYICRSQHCHMWMRSDRLSQLDVASGCISAWGLQKLFRRAQLYLSARALGAINGI